VCLSWPCIGVAGPYLFPPCLFLRLRALLPPVQPRLCIPKGRRSRAEAVLLSPLPDIARNTWMAYKRTAGGERSSWIWSRRRSTMMCVMSCTSHPCMALHSATSASRLTSGAWHMARICRSPLPLAPPTATVSEASSSLYLSFLASIAMSEARSG